MKYEQIQQNTTNFLPTIILPGPKTHVRHLSQPNL